MRIFALTGGPRGRRPAAVRQRPRPARPARRRPPASLNATPALQQLSSGAALVRRRAAAGGFSIRPGVALPGIALVLTTGWFVVNVPRLSLLDLPVFAYTWFAIWLVLFMGHLIWTRLRERFLTPRR